MRVSLKFVMSLGDRVIKESRFGSDVGFLGLGHYHTRRRVAAAGPDRRGGADASPAVDAKEVGVCVICRRDVPVPLLQSVPGR